VEDLLPFSFEEVANYRMVLRNLDRMKGVLKGIPSSKEVYVIFKDYQIVANFINTSIKLPFDTFTTIIIIVMDITIVTIKDTLHHLLFFC
jgi:hypothetical protein